MVGEPLSAATEPLPLVCLSTAWWTCSRFGVPVPTSVRARAERRQATAGLDGTS